MVSDREKEGKVREERERDAIPEKEKEAQQIRRVRRRGKKEERDRPLDHWVGKEGAKGEKGKSGFWRSRSTSALCLGSEGERLSCQKTCRGSEGEAEGPRAKLFPTRAVVVASRRRKNLLRR